MSAASSGSGRYVLVTGGAGYVGSHACKALAQAGYTPVSFDDLSRGHGWAVRWGPLVQESLQNRRAIAEALRNYQPIAVVHFAAFSDVGESATEPHKYYENNVGGTLNLLEAMRAAGCKSIVFSSTCATYGMPSRLPIEEDAPQFPINPYGASKLMIERILQDYGRAYGLGSISLRYFNAAGADSDNELGEAHDPETHLVPLVLEVAAGASSCVSVFGNDYATRDGTCIRDYVHVTDLAAAHVLALERVRGSSVAEAFNLGTGFGHTVMEVIETCEKVTGKDIPWKLAPRRSGDAAELVAAHRKAQSTLNWTPRHSDLETIIGTAWRWRQCSRT